MISVQNHLPFVVLVQLLLLLLLKHVLPFLILLREPQVLLFLLLLQMYQLFREIVLLRRRLSLRGGGNRLRGLTHVIQIRFDQRSKVYVSFLVRIILILSLTSHSCVLSSCAIEVSIFLGRVLIAIVSGFALK